ncbi:MAG TPA: TolC family protein [bacterium]|nr:TolC family protein [bacterium]
MNSKIITVVLLLWPAGAQAADVLTLEKAVQEVLAANQDVQAAGYRIEAAKARIPQAKALDDPMVGVTFEDVPLDTADVTKGEKINYRVEQKLPFPGKRHVRGKAARFDAEAVSEGSRGRVQDILLDLKSTYYDLYRLDRSLAVNRETQALLRQFLGSTEEAYAAGKTSADAPLKAQVELSKLQNEEVLLDQERQTHMAHLKALLNHENHRDDPRLPSNLSWPRLSASLEEMEAMASESRPELGALRALEKRDVAKVTSAKQSVIPDFAFAFEYNQVPNSIDHWTGTAAINVPIYFGKNRGQIREAKASLKATQAEHQSLEVHTRHEIEQAYSAVKAAQKIVGSYQSKILPQAKTTLEASRLAYASSKVDFLTLIDAARTYKDLQMSFYENQARLGTSFAELERLVGRNL